MGSQRVGVETVADVIFWGSKNTADGDWSHEIKGCLLLGSKVMINLDSILKSRDISLPTKLHLVKAMVFSVVIYRCKSWTIKKAKHWRIYPFEMWCWRRPLRVPWKAKRSNQSILNEINTEYSLERMILKLRLQYFGHVMWRANSLEKTMMLGKSGGRKRRRQQRMRWLDSFTNSTDMNLSKLQETVEDRVAWHAAVNGVVKGKPWFSIWTTTKYSNYPLSFQQVIILSLASILMTTDWSAL